MTALRDWADQLVALAIPDAVLAGTGESPWVLPRPVFTRRADAQIARPAGATYTAAVEAAAGAGRASVLDVGAAAGATSLPLVGRAAVSQVVAVDADAELLAAFSARAEALGVPARVLCGTWPELADQAGTADIVLCGNVVYNVAELGPFVWALTRHARGQVIVELAAVHPMTELNPLWHRFHGITRPSGPTAADCVAALTELGITPRVTRWRRGPEAEHESFADLVDVTRRRLCLPPQASAEVGAALLDLGIDQAVPPDLGSSGRELVTLSWPGTG